MTDLPLVSCLCLTRQRVHHLARAIACFQRQTYPARELLVVYEDDDAATREFLAGQDLSMIRPVEVPLAPARQLGGKRNLAIAASTGAYIAQWDDDDWHSPNRLSAQMQTVRASGKAGCVLWRWIMLDMWTRRASISKPRAWEGSLLMRREAMPLYPDVQAGEDTPVVERLFLQNQLACLDSPELYVYIYHGNNTWHRAHWESLLAEGRPLSAEATQQVLSIVGLDDDNPSRARSAAE